MNPPLIGCDGNIIIIGTISRQKMPQCEVSLLSSVFYHFKPNIYVFVKLSEHCIQFSCIYIAPDHNHIASVGVTMNIVNKVGSGNPVVFLQPLL